MECLTAQNLVDAILNVRVALTAPFFAVMFLGLFSGVLLGWLSASSIVRKLYALEIKKRHMRKEFEHG